MSDKLSNILIVLEKRITQAVTGLILFSILISYFLYESYSAFSKLKFINNKLKDQIYLSDLEEDRNDLLNKLEKEYKKIDFLKNKKKANLFIEEFRNLRDLNSQIVSLFKTNRNFLAFEMDEAGNYVYPNGDSVIEFWEKINEKNILVKYTELQNDKIGGINFFKYYDRMNSINPITKTNKLPYSTLLKMQNLYASYLQTNQRIIDYFNLVYENVYTIENLNDSKKQEIQESIKLIKLISTDIKRINSKIKETLNIGILNTPLIDAKKEIREKYNQNLNFNNLSLNIQNIIAVSPLILFFLSHWLYLNLSRYESLSSEIEINELHITSLFLIYPSIVSEISVLLLFALPLLATIFSILYLLFDIETINETFDILILKSDLYTLLVLTLISIVVCYKYLSKCLDLLQKIKKNKRIR